MFERGISYEAITAVVSDGEIIAVYPDDKPYPSWLLLEFSEDLPIHVVVARDTEARDCIVVTAYQPLAGPWERGFRRRKEK